jgi:hypothetical protein
LYRCRPHHPVERLRRQSCHQQRAAARHRLRHHRRPAAVTLNTELPGRTEASRIAQVRARTAGIVLQRVYKEGGE